MAGSFDPLPQGMEDFLAQHQAPDQEKAALREHLMKVVQAQSAPQSMPSKLHGLLNNLFDHLKTPEGREEYLKLTKNDAAFCIGGRRAGKHETSAPTQTWNGVRQRP